MTKMKGTKRALMTSAVALLLCFSMLIGTTYAWFTDSVSTVNNIITAGNLDVELYWSTTPTDSDSWKKVSAETNVFEKDTLWEPGHTEVVYLKIVNEGTLALKYQIGVTVDSEIIGKTEDGKDIKLSEHIEYGAIATPDLVSYANRAAARDAVTSSYKLSSSYTKANNLLATGDDDYITLVVYMPESVGNEANYRGTAIPTINLGINLYATQYTHEEDSFDNQYDAATAVFTVAEANAMMLTNKDTTLVNCIEPEGVLEVPANFEGTLTIVNSTVKSVQGAGDVNLVILGNVTVNAKGTGATTLAATTVDGSAITANGKLNISGKGNLTAIADDVNGAFGIGGMNTTEISIKDITIDYASGSYAYGVGTDTKYYKDAPEGGAAIGSGKDGAVITLDNVTVLKAIGGSKAAGIGARYHVGVTVNITDSTIVYVEGGVSAAGIGGSRVSGDGSESGTTINITNSNVTAKGGAYGAGIGSGYDTHCSSKQPLCTINITDSTINATGGQYAAGVGTGYHNAALAGEIKNSTVNAVSGDKYYKDSYTCAMGVGFGVVDPAREGQQTDSYIIYNGVKITIPAPGRPVSTLEELKKALEDKVSAINVTGNILVDEPISIEYEAFIHGNGYTISRADGYTGNVINVAANSALTLENIKVDGGAVWTGTVNSTLDRGTVNSGATVTGNLIAANSNSKIVLGNGAVLQNNDGAHAVNLGTRIGATLTLNGGEIINNNSDSGAVWGGGHITVNSGKISYNSSTGSAGAIRMVSNCNLTMNGGEISNNVAAASGGAIWGYGASTYNLAGGKMSGNTAATGGAIYTGDSSTINMSGSFEMCNNTATGEVGAIRLSNRTAFNMSGGKMSGNISTNNPDWNGFYGWNPAVNISGGELADDIYISGGLTPTVAKGTITGVIHFVLSTNHNTANLFADFSSFKFTVAEGANFAAFNLKPATGYTYTEGDESKLICMNEGYETYWDTVTSTFKIKAK